MWTKLGSLRERVREHAKSAAQVAQGVLQAAAAEDEVDPMHPVDYSHSEQGPQQDGWDDWNQNSFEEDAVKSPPPPASPPPPPAMLAPPPVPESHTQSASDVSARKGARRSRYVVTGIAASKPQASALAPPIPTSFVTPANPITEQKNGYVPADDSQLASQHTPSETLSPEAAPAETEVFIGTGEVQAAEASQPNEMPSDLEPVPDIQGSAQDTFRQVEQEDSSQQIEQEPQETVGFINEQPFEEKPLEAEAVAGEFIDWGDDGWNVEGDEVDEMYSEDPKPLAQETGEDVDWFSVAPSKPEDTQNSFPPVVPESTQFVEADAVSPKDPSDTPDADNGAQQVLGDPVSRERESELVSFDAPGVQPESAHSKAEAYDPVERESEFVHSASPEEEEESTFFAPKASDTCERESEFVSFVPPEVEQEAIPVEPEASGTFEGESDFVSSTAPGVPQESFPFEPETSNTFQKSDSLQLDSSTNEEKKDDVELDNSPFTTHDDSQTVDRSTFTAHDESQQPPLEVEDSYWMPNNILDPTSLANECVSETKQRVDVADNSMRAEPILTEQETKVAQVEIREAFPVYATGQEQDAKSAHEVESLRNEIQRITEERDRAMVAKSDEEHRNEDLKRSILTLKDELERTQEQNESLEREKALLHGNVEIAVREKQDAEAERDAAIERGGDGIKEARHLIEVMRGNEDAAREREAMVTEQMETMTSDMERISSERNALIHETDDLQRQLQHVQSQAQLQEEHLKQQLQIASHEREIAELNREKALESIKVHAQEYENLYADERNRLAALQEKDVRIHELERAINSREKDKEEEDMRIDLLSKQIEAMNDRTHEIIEERNSFYQEKLGLENEIESFGARHEQAIRDLQDAKRDSTSLKGERDEARSRYSSMRDQNAELRKRFEALASERDRLIQERTAAAASSDSVSDREKVLAQECEQKTRSLALMQRKVTSLSSKIEKLTMQRGTFQRQRDEASARLRAAGEEFMTLHSKLESMANERDGLKTDIVRIREERDNANFRAQELSRTAAEHVLVQEKLQSKVEELEELSNKLEDSRNEVSELLEKESSLKQKGASLANEISQLHGRVEVLLKEKDAAVSQNSASEQEKTEMRQKVVQLEEDLAAMRKKVKTLEVDLCTTKETSGVEVGIVKAELLAEQKSRQEAGGKLATLQTEVSSYQETVADIQDKIRSSLQNASAVLEQSPNSFGNALTWPEIPDENQNVDPSSTIRMVTVYAELLSKVVHQALTTSHDYELTKQQLNEYDVELTKQAEEKKSRQEVERRCALLENELASTQRSLQSSSSERDSMRQQLEELTSALTTSKIRESELDEQLRVAHETLRMEIEKMAEASTGEVEQARQELQKLTSSLKTVWGMIQKSLDVEHFETFTDDGSEFADREVQSNIGVHVLRGTASLVAELSRTRSHLEESTQRCQNAENEVERLTDRAEIAEQERDAFRGSNERLERKANNSRSEGHEEAKKHYEDVIVQMEDEIEDFRHNLNRMTDKFERSEKEAGELRALCTKLTSQINSRTNELDEAEEKIVYLQDQVTTLGEDLGEAHRRLQKHEEESAVAQREEVERLTAELQESSSELEKTLEMCSKLQSISDEAEAKAKECELLAETHRQAEENLRIAIEQLEAAQDSLVEQRTIELQRKLNDMDAVLSEAKERVASVNVTENKLKVQDEEIKELRGAIGRLADERVELKLELEKSLSRLNHPEAGGQLVDRRVVRQLLVSYFRVGSVRKRDVLELMSRMLAFSESDNIAVGLKRRALIDRLGSLVQAPELDDASLPPIGTVSDKWIEFLMKETEEGEEQAKGW